MAIRTADTAGIIDSEVEYPLGLEKEQKVVRHQLEFESIEPCELRLRLYLQLYPLLCPLLFLWPFLLPCCLESSRQLLCTRLRLPPFLLVNMYVIILSGSKLPEHEMFPDPCCGILHGYVDILQIYPYLSGRHRVPVKFAVLFGKCFRKFP